MDCEELVVGGREGWQRRRLRFAGRFASFFRARARGSEWISRGCTGEGLGGYMRDWISLRSDGGREHRPTALHRPLRSQERVPLSPFYTASVSPASPRATPMAPKLSFSKPSPSLRDRVAHFRLIASQNQNSLIPSLLSSSPALSHAITQTASYRDLPLPTPLFKLPEGRKTLISFRNQDSFDAASSLVRKWGSGTVAVLNMYVTSVSTNSVLAC